MRETRMSGSVGGPGGQPPGSTRLPDALTVVPFPVAAVLSTALVCTLPAVWVCQRKSVAVEEQPGG